MSAGGDGPVTQSPDTAPDVEALLVEAQRRLPPHLKWRQVCEAIAADDAHALAGLRLRHPGADERELRLRLVALKYGRELAVAAFGWDPGTKGW